jgi:t-SNARE complex subunit (syntaxin)
MALMFNKEVDGANAATATSVEMQPLKMLDKDMSASTADFFETFDENVVANIDKIKRNVEEVKVLQKKILSSVKADEKDASENRMNDLVEENKRLSRKIQVQIQQKLFQLVNYILSTTEVKCFLAWASAGEGKGGS